MDYNRRLQEIKDHDLNVLNSEEDFKSSIANLNEFYEGDENQDLRILENPIHIKEEVQIRQELFSKLKFQYIEQETKEKFLRAILDTPPLFIEQSDIIKIEDSNKNLKLNLKSKKQEANDFEKRIQELSKDLIAKNDEFNSKLAETETLIEDINSLESKIDELSKEDWNNNSNDLLKIYELLDSGNEVHNIKEIESEISNRFDELSTLQRKVTNLTTELNFKNESLVNSTKRAQSLNQTLDETNNMINLQNESENSSNSIENTKINNRKRIGIWFNEMCKIWCKISKVEKIDITNDENFKEITMRVKLYGTIKLRIDGINHIIDYDLSWVPDKSLNYLMELANLEKDPIQYFVTECTRFPY